MSETTQQKNWFTTGFELLEKSLNGEAHSPLHELRRAALDEFSRVGFPTTRNEEWRFTNIAPITKTNFRVYFKQDVPRLSKGDIKPFLISKEKEHLLVFVNGHFNSELSTIHHLPNGATLGNLAKEVRNNSEEVFQRLGNNAPVNGNPFNALNSAFIQDGFFLKLNDGVLIEEPIHCLFIASEDSVPFAVQPRNLIIAGKNSRANVIEKYVSLTKNSYLTNSVTEIVLSERSTLHYTKLQHESERAYHIATIHVEQHTASAFTSNSIALGGAIVRNNVLSRLIGENIICTLNGLSLGTGEQLIDNHTTIDHAMPNCESHELYKSILDGKARGVFNGKIFVRKDAQKTDAKQTNKTLLLSEDATIDTKPQLEIFADDVKCTHGATVGQLDENQIFYLRTRGFSNELARDVLTTAFANDVIDRIPNEALRTQLYELIFKQLHEGRTTTLES